MSPNVNDIDEENEEDEEPWNWMYKTKTIFHKKFTIHKYLYCFIGQQNLISSDKKGGCFRIKYS